MSPQPNQAIAKLTPGSRGGEDKRAQSIDPLNPVSTTVKPTAAGCFTLIERLIADGTSGVWEVDIPATYFGLQLELHGAAAALTGIVGIIYLHFNGDENTNYRWNSGFMQVTGFSGLDIDDDWGVGIGGLALSGNDYPAAAGTGVVRIPDYQNTSFWKHVQAWQGGITTNADGSIYGGYEEMVSGDWKSSAAVEHIKVRCQDSAGGDIFVAGSTLSVYGIC